MPWSNAIAVSVFFASIAFGVWAYCRYSYLNDKNYRSSLLEVANLESEDKLRHEHKYGDDGWCSCGVHALGNGPCVHWVGEVPEASYSAKCRKCGEMVPLVSATR